MRIVPSSVAGVELCPASAPEWSAVVPPEALPFTVIVRNISAQAIALVGLRFDMTGARGKSCSVVHYADMLRSPESAELQPGKARPICAEPSYTAKRPDIRGRMNLENLRRMISIRASLDCVAFADGRFEGTDSRGAFDRINHGSAVEQLLIEEVLASKNPRALLERLHEDRAWTSLARKLLEAGGDLHAAAAAHRCRIALWRP